MQVRVSPSAVTVLSGYDAMSLDRHCPILYMGRRDFVFSRVTGTDSIRKH